MPSKLHMTVPKDFRRSSAIPEILVLHRAHLESSELQEIHGVRVTRPCERLSICSEAKTMDRSQLKLAVDEAIRRGLIAREKSNACRTDKLQRSLQDLRSTRMTEEAQTYKDAGAFRTALETPFADRARAEGTDLQRLRRQVAFDRFLARMVSKEPTAPYPWVLKGGYAMSCGHIPRDDEGTSTDLHDGTRWSKDPT